MSYFVISLVILKTRKWTLVDRFNSQFSIFFSRQKKMNTKTNLKDSSEHLIIKGS